MATRSTIALEYADGTVDMVYCHFDGYLENNGRILKEHWSDPFKLQQLMDLGSISSLGNQIGRKQNFDDRTTHNRDWCLAYGRDRGEAEVGAWRFKSYEHYLKSAQLEEYNYILRQVNGQAVWFVQYWETETFVPLEKALDRIAVEVLK